MRARHPYHNAWKIQDDRKNETSMNIVTSNQSNQYYNKLDDNAHAGWSKRPDLLVQCESRAWRHKPDKYGDNVDIHRKHHGH